MYRVEQTIQGIDLATVGQYSLQIVPTDSKFLLTSVILQVTAVSDFTTPAIIRIGKTTLFTEWMDLFTLTGLELVDQFTELADLTDIMIHSAFQSDEEVMLDVQTAAGATTFKVDAHIKGLTV